MQVLKDVLTGVCLGVGFAVGGALVRFAAGG